MSDSALTREQAICLLEKLARDSSFRVLFETAPARALRSLDISSDTIVQLPAACLQFKTLASMAEYEELLKSCSDATINGAMQMAVPHARLKQ